MSAKQTINVTTTLGSPTVSKTGFGVQLIVVEAESSVFSTRTKIYADIGSVAVDFATTTAEYKAANACFSQVNPPPYIIFGRKEVGDADYTASMIAIKAENNDWSLLNTMTRTQAEVLLVAAWAESNKKLYVSAENAVAGTIATAIEALGYNRTLCLYHSTADGTASDVFADCGWVARMAITTPGATAWAEKAVVGVTADDLTEGEIATLEAVNCNYFVDTADGTLSYVGKVASGEWADVIRFADWLAEEIAFNTFSLKLSKSAANSKIPYTSKGITMIEGEIDKACSTGRDNGGLESYVITMPDISTVSSADKLARVLNNTKVVGVLAGAILYVNIQVNLEV